MSVARVARNIGSGYVGAAVNGMVLLLLTPLVVRHLGPRGYGIWVLATAIGSYLGFLNAGSGAAGVRAVARLAGTGRIGEASRDVGSIFRIYLAVGIFAGGALTLLSFTTLDYFHVPAAERAEVQDLLMLIAGSSCSMVSRSSGRWFAWVSLLSCWPQALACWHWPVSSWPPRSAGTRPGGWRSGRSRLRST